MFGLFLIKQEGSVTNLEGDQSTLRLSPPPPPFTLMAGLLNACVHSGLFLVVSGRLRVLQLTVSSRFWDQYFHSKGTDVAQRRMWIHMMDHCLDMGEWVCDPASERACVCVCGACMCVSVSIPVSCS